MADLDGLAFKKTYIAGRPVLAASDIHAEEWLAKIGDGTEVLMSGRRPRNIRHHKKLFAILHYVVQNTNNIWADEEALLQELKLATGLTVKRRGVLLDDKLPSYLQIVVDWLEDFSKNPILRSIPRAAHMINGSADAIKLMYSKTLEVQITGSISFASMSQDRFETWYENATHLLATEVLGCAPEELRDAVIEMVGEDQPRSRRKRKERNDGDNNDSQHDGRHDPELDRGDGQLLGRSHQGDDGEGGDVLPDRAERDQDALEEAEGRARDPAHRDPG